MVVLRSPIHANEPSEYNGMLYRTSNRVLNNGIKVIILICMDGTSQYHHHLKAYTFKLIHVCTLESLIVLCLLGHAELTPYCDILWILIWTTTLEPILVPMTGQLIVKIRIIRNGAINSRWLVISDIVSSGGLYRGHVPKSLRYQLIWCSMIHWPFWHLFYWNRPKNDNSAAQKTKSGKGGSVGVWKLQF